METTKRNGVSSNEQHNQWKELHVRSVYRSSDSAQKQNKTQSNSTVACYRSQCLHRGFPWPPASICILLQMPMWIIFWPDWRGYSKNTFWKFFMGFHPQQIKLKHFHHIVVFFLESFLSSCGKLSSLHHSLAPRKLFKGLKQQTSEWAIWSFVLWTENSTCCCCRNPSLPFVLQQKWI